MVEIQTEDTEKVKNAFINVAATGVGIARVILIR